MWAKLLMRRGATVEEPCTHRTSGLSGQGVQKAAPNLSGTPGLGADATSGARIRHDRAETRTQPVEGS